MEMLNKGCLNVQNSSKIVGQMFGHLDFLLDIWTMNKENVIAILDKLDIPVSKIESDIGMPSGTLAKAKRGVRGLPDKWDCYLLDYYERHNKLAELRADIPGLKVASEMTGKECFEKSLHNFLPPPAITMTHEDLQWMGVRQYCEKHKITAENAMDIIERSLKQIPVVPRKSGKVSVQNFTKENPKGNYSIDTTPIKKMTVAEQRRLKSQGLL